MIWTRLDRSTRRLPPSLTHDQIVQAEVAEDEAQRRTGLSEEQWRARMASYPRQRFDRGQHPYLERIVVEAEDFPDVDATFERRLGLVLDGLAARLRR